MLETGQLVLLASPTMEQVDNSGVNRSSEYYTLCVRGPWCILVNHVLFPSHPKHPQLPS